MKFHCDKCNRDFEINYFKWLFTTLFHWFGKRLTKCPYCKDKIWVKPIKK